jgi:hypothetical protein
VPLFKLHGSLNWSLDGLKVVIYPDVRPAFRGGGSAAIVPPLPEKETPPWLEPVWSGAEQELARAESWIVVGYSLPEYDVAIQQLLIRAAAPGTVQTVVVHDPYASALAPRWQALRRDLAVEERPGLPIG